MKKSNYCKEIQPVYSKGDQPWDFFGRNDAKAETPVLWPPHAKSRLIGKDSDAGRDCRQEEKGTIEDEMAGWHHRLNGREFEWSPGVGDGQGGLVCCNSWVAKSWTRLSDWTELNWTECHYYLHAYGRNKESCSSLVLIIKSLTPALELREGLGDWNLFSTNKKWGTQIEFCSQEGPPGSCLALVTFT